MENSTFQLNKLNIHSETLEKSIYSILTLLKKYGIDLLDYFEDMKQNR